jgi:hypothetical protein
VPCSTSNIAAPSTLSCRCVRPWIETSMR